MSNLIARGACWLVAVDRNLQESYRVFWDGSYAPAFYVYGKSAEVNRVELRDIGNRVIAYQSCSYPITLHHLEFLTCDAGWVLHEQPAS